MTAQNSARAKITSFHKSVTGNGILGVMRAGGVKTTLIADEKTEGVLVNSDQLDSELSQHVKSPVILQLFRGLVCGFVRGLAVAAPNQILPQSVQNLVDGGIVQRVQSFACQNNDVQPGEQMLTMSKRFANQPFDPISLHCQANVFLGNYQAQSGRNIIMSDCKNQKLGTGDLVLRLTEDGLIVRSRQEPQISTKTMTGYLLVGHMQLLSVKSGRQLGAAS
ncbi:hypothetical protein LCGC14_0040060 [marine sediment metagenome]|uniref:Uncharacterized protein n=1 Tax=marine sediment metagenome TaxID=412755 RepID=A0A0F9YA79_9ZZZZ